MKKIIFFTLFISLFIFSEAKADKYVPEFDKMQSLKCEIEETLYNQDDSIVSQTNYHRLFRLDDANSILYSQKEPVSNVYAYGLDKIEFREQSMTDDFIIYSQVNINRNQNSYISESKIIYDNPEFSPRKSKAQGICKILN